NTWPAGSRDALDTVAWFALRVWWKIHRALSGLERQGDELEDDPVQSDWNGSAKVARLDIAESKAAWQVLLDAGSAPADSPMRELIAWLDRLDADVAA